MRIIFCGSGDFGLPTLRRLAFDKQEIAFVLTQPPRPAGRGGQARETPVALAAAELGLPVRAVEDINASEVVAEVAAAKADVMLVVDFGQMIRQPVRDAVRMGAVNLHGSVLPELRGAAPVNWAIIRGHATSGVTTFQIVDRMDAGEMFDRRETPIRPDETAEDLRHRLSELGVESVIHTLGLLAAGQTRGEVQDESKATKAPRLKKTDGVIDWCADAVAVRNRIHGAWPWPAGQTNYVSTAGRCVPVVIARCAAHDHDQRIGLPGLVLGDMTIACGLGRLEILQLKPAGGRMMDWRSFCNGYRVTPGAAFLATKDEA